MLDAVLDLFSEDNLSPGPEEVAVRVGLSVRSVYRYFDDHDALTRAAIARNIERRAPLLRIPAIGEGDLDDRIDRFVEAGAGLQAEVGPDGAGRPDPGDLRPGRPGRHGGGPCRSCGTQIERHFAPELSTGDPVRDAARLAAVGRPLRLRVPRPLPRPPAARPPREARPLLVDALAPLTPSPTPRTPTAPRPRPLATKGTTPMADWLEYPFGTIDTETAGRWLHLAPEEDREVWMLNLMKYKPVADYGDGTTSTISGREADDIYAPTAVLADLGATVPLFGDVTRQLTDDVAWERIAIVRYPSRASFFAMQDREDFQKQYVHKEAGMETTIVMGCVPLGRGRPRVGGIRPGRDAGAPVRRGCRPRPRPRRRRARGALRGRRGHPRGRPHAGTTSGSTGSTRRPLPLVARTEGVAEQVVVVVDPLIEDLIGSVVTAGA